MSQHDTQLTRPVSAPENVALIKTIYQQFTDGNIDGVLSHFTDDVNWETPGFPKIPYAGRFCGRHEVAKFFDGLGRTASFECFEPSEYIADGDRVVVFGFYSGKGRITQKPVRHQMDDGFHRPERKGLRLPRIFRHQQSRFSLQLRSKHHA
jgi:ketosteroid isomerase-like protein